MRLASERGEDGRAGLGEEVSGVPTGIWGSGCFQGGVENGLLSAIFGTEGSKVYFLAVCLLVTLGLGSMKLQKVFRRRRVGVCVRETR